MLDPGEQCDDNNHFDLDGCDSACGFEVVTRMSTISISGMTAPNFCVHPANAFGTKVIANALVLGELNTTLQQDVTSAAINVVTQFLGLSDPTGTNATGWSLGIADATPDPARGAWPGNNPMDWSFLADATVVNMGLPTGQLGNGKIVNHKITAGPSTVTLTLSFAGTPANLTMNNAAISGTVGNATNSPMPPPAQVEAGLKVLETITANGNGQGLCGDITVASLAQVPVPQALTGSSMTACTEGYTYCGVGMPVGPTCNSLLDVIIGGCHVSIISGVNPTQPDVAGSGGAVQQLSAGALKKVSVPAGDKDAYSAFLQFATTREHFSGQSCTTTAECQSGQTCTMALCTPQ
jgi:cysteine-rich repeat protein